STLRLLISDVKNAEIAKGEELTDEETTEVVQKKAKKHKESIEAFKKAQRNELVDKEEAELRVIDKYLPKQMDKQEIEKVVDEVISESGVNSIYDMGKVMGQVMAKLKGKADGNLVSGIVKSKLNTK
ncbi:glutamyl-tRNA amidotransferase, partial [Candidatus Curtissbacteria bacterium RBG_13_35_7]